ncbi:MAG: hypothetical protein ACKESB_01960 [Candidatus Hodgkinia cicadicola]
MFSFSNTLTWQKLKSAATCGCVCGSLAAAFNPKARYRKRFLVYVLNYNVLISATLLACVGRRLDSRHELIASSLVESSALSSICMLTLVVVGGPLKLVLAPSGRLKCFSS